MRKVFTLSLGLFLLVNCVSCKTTKHDPGDNITNVEMPLSEMNSDLQITASEDINTFKIGDTIIVDVDNLSDNLVIKFSPEVDVRIFEREGEKWNEIENVVGYPSDFQFLLPPNKKNEGMGTGLFFKPLVKNTSEAVTIRILIIGIVYQNNKLTSEQAGAYLDINLTP